MRVVRLVAVFPMLVLFNPITPSVKVKSHIISEEQYFSNSVDVLKPYYCPECKDFNGLWHGFYWIQCNNCRNCYYTIEEFIKYHQIVNVNIGVM